MCGDEENRRVCFETQTIQITGEGTCVYAEENKPCTWYGYSFDYQLPEGKSKVTLQCSSWMSHPGNFGNPTAELERDADKGLYELELVGSEDTFFNPQYSVLPASLREPGRVIRYKQTCSYVGTKLFEILFELHYPER